jgi:hypothetical protein
MAERLIAPVLKTGIVLKNYRGFESLSLLFLLIEMICFYWFCSDWYHKERGMARLSHLAKPEKQEKSIR